nr:MAG TPA_asm: hypothetical protein [Caudoviricetes sp.]
MSIHKVSSEYRKIFCENFSIRLTYQTGKLE